MKQMEQVPLILLNIFFLFLFACYGLIVILSNMHSKTICNKCQLFSVEEFILH